MNFSLLVKDLGWHSLIFFVVTALGYLFVSGSLYALVFLRGAAKHSPIATRKLKADLSLRNIWLSVRHDVVLSLWSSAIFAVCASATTTAYTLGYTRLYTEPTQYGWWYLGFSLCLVLFLQDTYFYFTHRLAHHPRCYRWMHQGHHRSNNPTPLTAFSFDPAEALVQALYLMGAVCFIPMHLFVLYAVVLAMSLGALLHHFSIRMFADSAFGRWLGSWMIGPMHHWYHHRKYNVHYGLYFTFWDKLLKTHCDDYEEKLTLQITPQTVKQLGKPSLSIARSPQRKTLPFPVPFKKAS
ncbi:sterol desaturase family protein [cf. Phormidesmis sp. LEGE 11477]|uniref:sterol desaturase family protein n=1 Tax=cf. Phormidesmis sp. LEGE 11477 TaxID=1828680 RepID=UPI001881A57F|nr:sterol desaturase family protein [cf. Phormidesmis sp. LEGE 11477]MBE9062959.1 sterol desaturase family protein [cf. Phormidesmis sp. LEGE 11477]